ncbi:MAG: tetratricopeptide repeat protein [Verrucomicrobiota bacterium]
MTPNFRFSLRQASTFPFRLLIAAFLLQLGAGLVFSQDEDLAEAEKLREEAQVHLQNQDLPKAIETFLDAFKISPGTSQEYRLVSQLLLIENRPEEAVILLKEGEQEHPESLPIKADLGVAYNATEQFDLALQTFERPEIRVGQTNPTITNDSFYFSYGAAAERLKKYDLAEKNFRKAIERVPITDQRRAAMPLNYLGYMWLDLDKNLDEAGIFIVKANNLVPDSDAYADSLGWWHFKKKNYKAALSELLRAADLMGDAEDPVIFDHIAQTYFEMGQKKKAIEYLEKATKLDPENEEIAKRLKQYRKPPPQDP